MSEGMPPGYHVADSASLAGQKRFVRNIRIQLTLLLVAGVASAVSWRAGEIDVAALIAGVAFLIAAGLRLNSLSTSPHQRWYEGRAAAESIKTLAWRYAVGGMPFPIDNAPCAVDELFLRQTREIASEMNTIPIEPGDEVTDWMRSMRASDLGVRKSAYLASRIEDQERWYASKSQWNVERTKLWSRTTLAAEAVGAIGAFLAGFGIIHIDIFGLAGAIAAVTAAWLETKQHHALASAYGVAADELRSIAVILKRESSEEEWAQRVSDSEEAISREHTLWRARVSKA